MIDAFRGGGGGGGGGGGAFTKQGSIRIRRKANTTKNFSKRMLIAIVTVLAGWRLIWTKNIGYLRSVLLN